MQYKLLFEDEQSNRQAGINGELTDDEEQQQNYSSHEDLHSGYVFSCSLCRLRLVNGILQVNLAEQAKTRTPFQSSTAWSTMRGGSANQNADFVLVEYKTKS